MKITSRWTNSILGANVEDSVGTNTSKGLTQDLQISSTIQRFWVTITEVVISRRRQKIWPGVPTETWTV
ncbi:unnamed protein product [Blepharisma stoltei]|uniref:Uncharacterized protein n=1 Tax=Blepharisma stoltei TaxID=1481888 RepID=A0AAU9K205_9CILI|nr:unnamed protein product [Blepharisma stoltei]